MEEGERWKGGANRVYSRVEELESGHDDQAAERPKSDSEPADSCSRVTPVERQGACKGSGAANCQRHQEGAEREWRRGLSKAEARSAKGFEMRKNTCRWKRVAALAAAGLLLQPVLLAEVAASALPGPTKQKIRGYMTARIDASTGAIMDDKIPAGAAKIVSRDSSGERPISDGDTATGMMVEAQGVWPSDHQFLAEKI